MPRKQVYTPPTEGEWKKVQAELKRLQARVNELLDANNRFEYGYQEEKRRADKNAEAVRRQADEHRNKLSQIQALIGDDVPNMRRMPFEEMMFYTHPMYPMMRR